MDLRQLSFWNRALWKVWTQYDCPGERTCSPEYTVVVDSDWRFDNLCGSYMYLQSQSELITSVDGIKLWLLTWLVNDVAMLLVVCQLSRDVIGYEDS